MGVTGLTEDEFKTFLKQHMRYGGGPKTLFVSPLQKMLIDDMHTRWKWYPRYRPWRERTAMAWDRRTLRGVWHRFVDQHIGYLHPDGIRAYMREQVSCGSDECRHT